MIAEKDYLKEIKLKELEPLLLGQHYPENTSSRAALPRKNYKSSYKKSFKNTPKGIKKCKEKRKKEDLNFYFNVSEFNLRCNLQWLQGRVYMKHKQC